MCSSSFNIFLNKNIMNKTLLFILIITTILISCQKGDKTTNPNTILGCMDETALNYDTTATEDDGSCEYEQTATRSEILTNITNNIIIPAYDNLRIEIENLRYIAEDFTNNPNTQNISELRNSWLKAYISWQAVEMFNIGKAEEIDYLKTMNTYPCNPTRINNNIESQSYNLSESNFPSWTVQGFPALDYMLYGLASDSNLILDYYLGSDGSKYLAYLNDIIIQMENNTNLIVNDWQANKESFISSNGNTATSSLNLLTNDFIYYYEKGLRANKIGIPSGIWNGFQIYEIGVEAYYRKNISKQLCLKALNSCIDFFNGKHINSESLGGSYKDILTQHGDSNLCDDIINGLNEAESAINNLDDNFRKQLIENNTSMLNTYDELQDVVPMLKVQMLYSLNITVDYQDSDGD